MIKFDVHLTKQQLAALRALSTKTGLSLAEQIRRAVDDFLRREDAWELVESAETDQPGSRSQTG